MLVSVVSVAGWQYHRWKFGMNFPAPEFHGLRYPIPSYIDYEFITIFGAGIYLMGLIFNGIGLHRSARYILIVFGGMHVFAANIFLPDQSGPLYWAGALTVVPILVFSREDRSAIVLTYSWFVLVLIVAQVIKSLFVTLPDVWFQFSTEVRFGGIIGVSAFCGTFIYYYRTAAARAEADLAASNAQLRGLLDQDARYLAWLRDMARFLRHEVRQPLAQINSCIELSRLMLSSDSGALPHLSNATIGVLQVSNLIERASRATDIEAFVRQSTSEVVDLAQLLAAEIEGFKNTYSGLGFRLYTCEAQLLANVDTSLIKEALGNLLSNAASYATENSEIEVNIANDEGFAAITVDNKGPMVSKNTEFLFGPFSSTRAGLSSVHQGLGLFLVHLVVAHYGGRASLCNLPDASGVRATMWIPLVNQSSSLIHR
jgi:signal transduction histidine kinase